MALPQLLQGAGTSACESGSEICSTEQNCSKTAHVFKLTEILCAVSPFVLQCKTLSDQDAAFYGSMAKV